MDISRMDFMCLPLTRTAALSVLLALVSNLAASRRGNEHVVTLDFAVVVCLSAEESLQKCMEV